jgi:hypothetical protein
MSTITDALPVERALRSHVRFLEDAADAWREEPEKAINLFPVAEVVGLAVTAGQIACQFWDMLRLDDAIGGQTEPERRAEMLRFLQTTQATLDRLCRLGRSRAERGFGTVEEFTTLNSVAAEVADRRTEAELGLPWDEAAAPKISPEAARKGKEAAKAGRVRDLGDAIRDLQTHG